MAAVNNSNSLMIMAILTFIIGLIGINEPDWTCDIHVLCFLKKIKHVLSTIWFS